MRQLLTAPLVALSAFFASSAGATTVEKLPNKVEVTHVVIGKGTKAQPTSHVEVHYEGTFKDGRVFDSSRQRGQTITFPLPQVVPCWTTGVSTMAEGGRAKLFCPAETAYGARGVGEIPPNTDLYFDVELVKVVR